ncbi:MAG: hypothetical protein CL843_14695 [Crocinitomicaceae bacterium]|nr:hypothetical protein [Crocinitomicaceae bacterium]
MQCRNNAAVNSHQILDGYTVAIVKDYSGLDGCGYMLEVSNEAKTLLLPQNLPEKFQKDGMKVCLKYTFAKEAMTICMTGKVILIEDIQNCEAK